MKHKITDVKDKTEINEITLQVCVEYTQYALKSECDTRDHPFKTSAICRRGGVKNWSNLPTDSSKKLPSEVGRGQK